jgi:hypothetical protein
VVLQIVKNLTDFVNADYRVRKHIRLCLENSFFRNQTQPSALNIAFQIAFCYKIGFGVESDKTKCDIWLRRSKRIADDLDAEKQDIQQRDWRNERLRSEGFLTELDLISEYRARGLEVA